MKFTDIPRAAWDTETTGTDVHEARIVTAAFTVRTPGLDDRTFSWVINPGVHIPDEVAEIHGYTDARVQAEGQEPAGALDEIAGYLALALSRTMPLVAFNQSFDWSILHYDLLRHGLPTVEQRLGAAATALIDPHVIDKQVMQRVRGAGMRKLKPTAERYQVELTDWHTAEADAIAALLIAEAQFERHARLAAIWDQGPAALFEAQQRWRAAQQTSLAAWFAGRGDHEAAASVSGAWPLIPAPTPEPAAEEVTAP